MFEASPSPATRKLFVVWEFPGQWPSSLGSEATAAFFAAPIALMDDSVSIVADDLFEITCEQKQSYDVRSMSARKSAMEQKVADRR